MSPHNENADIFEETGNYFEQSLNLIVYAYRRIKREKAATPYSRRAIFETIRQVRESERSHTEIEDYLRNNLVNNYLKQLRHKFFLSNFSIQPGSEESKSNVKTGIVDIKFENISATSMDGTGFIFECKRLNKYKNMQEAYIEDGMMRFISGKYLAKNPGALTGMIAFVEVDIEQKPHGHLPVSQLAEQLKQKINSKKEELNLVQRFSYFKLDHQECQEISGFKYSYLSKHTCNEDNRKISIHHLLLNYYDILVP
jgi:hypothetical protein